MLAIKLAAVLAALFTCSSGTAVNYCGAAMCGMSNAHTFCQYTEGPGPRCSGYIDDRLSSEEKNRVIGRMNRRRNEAALGTLQLPPASNMLKLRWVEELAREAQIWADQCSPPSYPEEHDACRDLFSISVGQCVASVVGEAPGLRPESMVDMWYLQGRQTNSYSTDVQKSTADFAQMLWSHTYLVGCARSRFMIEQNGRLRTVTRLVCNFAPRAEGPLWSPGAPASACPPRSGPDPVLPGLCTFHHNVSFTYDVTNATLLKEHAVLDTVLEIEQNATLNYHGSLDQMYLTKMVTASINNQTDQQHQVNSTEKHDIVEEKSDDKIDKEVTLNVTDNSDNNKNIIDDVIEKIINETSTARVSNKIFNTVGRHQSYNIEELNVVFKDSENGTTRPVTIKEDDVYNDYGPEDMAEQNDRDYIVTTTEGNVTITMTPVEMERTTKTILASRSSTNSSYIIESTPTKPSGNEAHNFTFKAVPQVETTTPYVQNDILKRLLDLSEKNEQNPSDPETARHLEEALDNMEKALASPPVSSKVRRDLRPDDQQQTQEPINNELSPKKELPREPTQTQNLKEIGTPDSAPIMAILSKYAPLMKSYEGFFSRSAASNTTRSLVLLLIGSLVSNGV